MKRKNLLLTFLLAALILGGGAVNKLWATSDFSDAQNVYYAIVSETTVKVTYPNSSKYSPYGSGTLTFTKPAGNIIIPKTIEYNSTEYTVVSIDEYAFSSCTGITYISFAEGINNLTSIGNSAFAGCTGLLSIDIPSCVTSIGSYVFDRCTSMINVTISDVTSIQTQAFGNCTSLKSFIIPSSVTSIQNNAFTESGLTSIIIPSTVTSLSGNAFLDCKSLESVTFASGKGITTLNTDVFKGCSSLQEVNFSNTGLKTIQEKAFEGCTSLATITIPASVTTINANPFYGCSALNEIIVAEGNTNFNSGNGANCIINNYNSLIVGCNGTVIPNTVTSISNKAFSYCTGLTEITIPDNVNYYGTYMFEGCSNLGSITINTTKPTVLSNYAFKDCTSLTSFIIPSGIEEIGQYTFQGCSGLTSILIPSQVTSIGNQAFYACTNLEKVTVLGETTTLGTRVFHKGFSDIIDNLTIYVPSNQVENYKAATNWSTYASNIVGVNVYKTAGTWAYSSNWSSGSVPTSSDYVVINAACQIANNYTGIADKIVLGPNGSLTIADGGQLICNNAVEATIQKNITQYTVEENQGENKTDGWYFIASPVSYNPDGTNLLSNTYDLFLYDEAQVMWRNYEQAGAYHHFSMEPAKGYLYANSEDTELSFAGLMPACTTNVAVDLSYSSGASMPGFNLVGNPFTNNLTSNVTIGGNPLSAYSYVEGGSEILSTTLADRAIKPAEGFLVQATGENQQLVFNPSSKGETATKSSFIRIEAGNADFMDRAYVQIGQGNTLRKMTINDNVSHVYVMSEGKDYAAATIQEAQGEMPVNFKAAKNGQYTITVNPENVEMDYLHLVDNLTGADIDLLATPSYTFNAKTTDYASRFRLLFAANGIEENGTSTSSANFAFISNGQLIVNGTGTLQIIDMTGRVVSTKSTEERISTNELTPGVYVVKLIGNETKTQKIVIE